MKLLGSFGASVLALFLLASCGSEQAPEAATSELTLAQVLQWPADDLIDLVQVCWLEHEPVRINMDANGCARLLPTDESGYSSPISIAEAVTLELLERGLAGDRAAWWLVMVMPSDGYLAEARGIAIYEAVEKGTMPPLINFAEAEMVAGFVAWELHKDLDSSSPMPTVAAIREQLMVRSDDLSWSDRFYGVLMRELQAHRDSSG